MTLRYWRVRLRLAGVVHRRGSTGNEWRCRLAEWLHASYRHGEAKGPEWRDDSGHWIGGNVGMPEAAIDDEAKR